MKYSVIVRINMVRLASYTLTRCLSGNRVCFTAQASVCAVFIFIIMEGL